MEKRKAEKKQYIHIFTSKEVRNIISIAVLISELGHIVVANCKSLFYELETINST